MTPRQIKAQKTKKKLLDTALRLFSQKGYDNVTVDEIVKASGSSKGAFYTHFKSKYEIFLEKFKEIDDFYIEFLSSLPDELGSYDKMMSLVEGQMIFLKDYLGKDILRTIYLNSLAHHTENFIVQKDRPLFQIVKSFVEEGQRNGEFKATYSPDEVTMLITRGMRGTLFDWCLYNETFDLLQESKKFISLILNGIKKNNKLDETGYAEN
jgi:AcrR family transcriptional regulator